MKNLSQDGECAIKDFLSEKNNWMLAYERKMTSLPGEQILMTKL